MKIQKYILATILISFLFGCSPVEKVDGDFQREEEREIQYSSDLAVDFKEVYSWVNLMPGPRAEPRFHITGEVALQKSAQYELEEMKLIEIRIYQYNLAFYTIDPKIREVEALSDFTQKYFIFSNPEGLELKPNFDIDKPIDAKFFFSDGSNTFEYTIQDISIEEAH